VPEFSAQFKGNVVTSVFTYTYSILANTSKASTDFVSPLFYNMYFVPWLLKDAVSTADITQYFNKSFEIMLMKGE